MFNNNMLLRSRKATETLMPRAAGSIAPNTPAVPASSDAATAPPGRSPGSFPTTRRQPILRKPARGVGKKPVRGRSRIRWSARKARTKEIVQDCMPEWFTTEEAEDRAREEAQAIAAALKPLEDEKENLPTNLRRYLERDERSTSLHGHYVFNFPTLEEALAFARKCRATLRVRRELESSLDGTYWTSARGRLSRARSRPALN
ncbi:hypothetical protein ACHAWF_018661 [Thalassiosira exigua]